MLLMIVFSMQECQLQRFEPLVTKHDLQPKRKHAQNPEEPAPSAEDQALS
jgi:hypothetical protein